MAAVRRTGDLDLEETVGRAQQYIEAMTALTERLEHGPASEPGLNEWQRAILDKVRREDAANPLLEGSQVVKAIAQGLRNVNLLKTTGAEATEARERAVQSVEAIFEIYTVAERIPKVRFNTVPAAKLAVRRMLDEAATAYCAGMASATALLCRTALELCLRDLLSAGSDDKLTQLISDARRAEILRDLPMKNQGDGEATEVEIARRIRDHGDAWAHGLEETDSDDSERDSLQLFWDTVSLLEAISIRKPRRR